MIAAVVRTGCFPILFFHGWSVKKEVHDLSAIYLHMTLLRQAFAHCLRFSSTYSCWSLGRVSVPVWVWLIILLNQPLIIALVIYCITNGLIRCKSLLGVGAIVHLCLWPHPTMTEAAKHWPTLKFSLKVQEVEVSNSNDILHFASTLEIMELGLRGIA